MFSKNFSEKKKKTFIAKNHYDEYLFNFLLFLKFQERGHPTINSNVTRNHLYYCIMTLHNMTFEYQWVLDLQLIAPF